MDTYLMKNDEQMQVERVQPQYKPMQYQQQQYPQPQYQQNQYSQQQKYPPQRGGGILEVEDNNKDEDLVEEEAQIYVIIVGSHDIFLEIIKVL